MMRATMTCVLIMVFTFMAQVVSGYEYQVSSKSYQQPNQHLAQAGQSTFLNAQQSVSYSTIKDNFIRHQINEQYINNNYYNGLENNIQSGISQNLQQINSIGVQPVQPIITKHIYFHVPPPDEDRVVQPLLTANRKKTYNLVFIKVPSQKPYFVNSQGVRTNPYTAVEGKTLIYVLVKNSEDQSQVLSKPSPPNHEVFYVKYKDSATNAASQINSGAVSQHSSVQSLSPGLINGL